jgi:hypothetical protein
MTKLMKSSWKGEICSSACTAHFESFTSRAERLSICEKRNQENKTKTNKINEITTTTTTITTKRRRKRLKYRKHTALAWAAQSHVWGR